MSYALENFQVYAQNYIGKSIRNSIFKKLPLLYMLTGIGGNQTRSDMRIGRPGVSDVFAGKKISKSLRETLGGFNSYCPPMLTRTVSNGKAMGSRDTMPTVSNPTTDSHDQLIGAAKFNWARKVEPVLVWKESLFRAKSSAGTGTTNQGKAIANVLEVASDVALNVHLDAWADAFWTGSPANQAADLWSNVSGITDALGSTTNIYGNVDRSVAANSQWTPQVVTAARSAVLSSIIDEFNLTLNCSIVGNGVDLILTTPAIYRTFKDEVRAKGQTVLANGLPEMGEFGFKQECLRFDNTYVMHDARCPTGYVAGLNLETWKVILGNDGKNFTVSEFVDLSKYTEGAKDAFQAFIDTRMILACEDPKVNGLMTNVS